MEAFAVLADPTRVAANLRVSLVAGFVGSALGAAANLLSGKPRHGPRRLDPRVEGTGLGSTFCFSLPVAGSPLSGAESGQ